MNKWLKQWPIELLTGRLFSPWSTTWYQSCFQNAGLLAPPPLECLFSDPLQIIFYRALKVILPFHIPQRPTVEKKLWYRSLLSLQPKQVGKGEDLYIYTTVLFSNLSIIDHFGTPRPIRAAGGLEAANLGHPHLASSHTEVLLDQSSKKETCACQSTQICSGIWETAWLAPSVWGSQSLAGCLHLAQKWPGDYWQTVLFWNRHQCLHRCRHGEHFLRSKSKCCTSVASSQSAAPGIPLQSSLLVTASLKKSQVFAGMMSGC